MHERRKNVRVRPSADYNVRAELVAGLVTVELAIMDMAIGGMGFLVDELFAHQEVGTSLRLRIRFPDFPPFETSAVIRHNAGTVGGKCGVSLDHLNGEQTQALRKTVAELQERGHSA